MVPSAGETTRPAELRPLNSPRRVHVLTTPEGVPRAVQTVRRGPRGKGARATQVTRVVDRWLVEDGWWRDPLCRMYWELELADGRLVTIYQDRISGLWEEQWYG